MNQNITSITITKFVAGAAAKPGGLFFALTPSGTAVTESAMTLRIELSSDTIASVSSASSLAVHIGSPVIALCRKLVEAGYPSSAEIECYRGETLSLHVRSIGEAAKLYVAATTTGRPVFRREASRVRAPLVSQSEPAAISLPSS